MEKHWHILNPKNEVVNKLQKELNCNLTFAKILVNRNITSIKQAKIFLYSSLELITPPHKLKNIKKAIRRIYIALKKKEKVLIFGDYDADGITATSILVLFLRYANGNVRYYIPHRINDGYDLQPSFIKYIAAPKKYKLIITVDCGSKSNNAIKLAKSIGIDTIVTDHHDFSDPPKDAIAILNPKILKNDSSLHNLAGVGVAFYLLMGLRKYLRSKGYWYNIKEPNLANLSDLVALGTIADIVPLIGENRLLTRKGLALINKKPRTGIKVLIQKIKMSGLSIDAEKVAFRIAPLLNAAGRIQHAKIACELLLSKNKTLAKKLVDTLFFLNCKRQNIEKKLLEEIKTKININPSILNNEILILEKENWCLGILGIAASKLAREVNKPVILLTSSKNGISKGSARSINEINIIKILRKNSNFLLTFGGHKLAAGLTLKTDIIPLFHKTMNLAVYEDISSKTTSHKIVIDDFLPINEIIPDLIDSLELLAPFGNNNPEPIFMDKEIKVISYSKIGNYFQKLKLKNKYTLNNTYNAIRYIKNKNLKIPKCFDRITYRVKWDRWRLKKKIQIIIEEVD